MGRDAWGCSLLAVPIEIVWGWSLGANDLEKFVHLVFVVAKVRSDWHNVWRCIAAAVKTNSVRRTRVQLKRPRFPTNSKTKNL